VSLDMWRCHKVVLDNTPVTDAGVAHLEGLTNLTALHLYGTRVTNRCRGTLKKLPRLKTVDLRATQITPAAIAELRRELPTLELK
jgi:hypothetical protein